MSSDEAPIEYDASGHIISPYYGYTPTRYVCYIFVVLFGISTLIHFGQAFRFRAWWLFPTILLACVGEVVGWAGRLWSSYSPLEENPFMIQIVCTIIAPTPLVGAIFITFGRMCARIGEQYGIMSAKLYSWVFLTCDIISLVIQSIGGGMAASSDSKDTSRLGSNIMLAGIVFQLVSLTVFCILMGQYILRYVRARRNQPLRTNRSEATFVADGGDGSHPPQGMDRNMKLLLAGVLTETLLLYIRAVYRTIELADGWDGRIIETEVYFNVLDGAMVVVALYAANLFHPARLLAGSATTLWSVPMGSKSSTSSEA